MLVTLIKTIFILISIINTNNYNVGQNKKNYIIKLFKNIRPPRHSEFILIKSIEE